MIGLYAVFALGIVAALTGAPSAPGHDGERPIDLRWFVPIAAALVAVTLRHEQLIAQAALAQRPLAAWMAGLPAVPVVDVGPPDHRIGPSLSLAAQCCALFETALLAALAWTVQRRRLNRKAAFVAIVAAVALAAIALRARGVLSADVYAYIAYGVLGQPAYHPGAPAFGAGLRVIAQLWGNPPPPCAYGPTWLIPATVLMHGVRDVADGVLRFRLAGVASIVAVTACLMAARAPSGVTLTFALNPMIWMTYAADAHNDLWFVALVLFGRLQAARPLIAGIFGGLAGAGKLPFVLIAALTGGGSASARRRTAIASVATAVAVTTSAIGGGRAYAAALARVGTAYHPWASPSMALLSAMALFGACAATAAALGWRRTAWPAAFSFAGAGYALFPWYAGWSIPYATLTGGAAWPFCLLPVWTLLTSTTYSATPLWTPLLCAVVVAALGYAGFLLFRRGSPADDARVEGGAFAPPFAGEILGDA